MPELFSEKNMMPEISKERLQMDMQREKYNDSDYLRKYALRPAVEDTIFQIKLHLRNGKSRYRGKIKVRCSSIMRSIAINFKRARAYRLKEALFHFILRNIFWLRSTLARKNIFYFFSAWTQTICAGKSFIFHPAFLSFIMFCK
jgi:hypothetical protein